MKTEEINILIACEESQAVCKAFRDLGFNAFSCDIQECSGGHPEWHFKDDCMKIIRNRGGECQNGDPVSVSKWHMMIAHPPCTYLSAAGLHYRNHPKHPDRQEKINEALRFFVDLFHTDIPFVAIENPVGYVNTHFRKPDQIIHPWMFGTEVSKKTCLWLKSMPTLTPTNIVGKGEFDDGKRKGHGATSKWISDAYRISNKEERRKARSKTFPCIAEAMADQWGKFIIDQLNQEE